MPPLTIVPVPGTGPEDVVLDSSGTAFTALHTNGVVLECTPERKVREVARAGGKGLGMELLPGGKLLLCNADIGLQVIDPSTGSVENLLETIEGVPFGICNNAAVAPDGAIYFTESTRKYHLDEFRRDLIEDTCTGRLMAWHPDRPADPPRTLLDGLGFANGVALDPKGSFVLVAETGHGKLHRVDLQDGRAEVFAHLPGYPDNLSVGSDGLFWVAVPVATTFALETLHKLPGAVRRQAARVPESLQPSERRVAWVMAFDRQGELVHFLEGDPSRYHYVTGVRERDGEVWLGSLKEDALAFFHLS